MTDEPKPTAPSPLNDRVKAAKSIVQLFSTERTVFLLCAIATFSVLIYLAVRHYQTHDDWALFTGLFVPTGGVFYCCRQILGMFTQTLNFIKDVK